MSDARTPEGRGPGRPHDAEPLFPSEGTFSPVVPLSEIDHAPLPLSGVDRAAHRARSKKEDEETLVPARAVRWARPSRLIMGAVIAMLVGAGLASGTYLIWYSRQAPPAPTPIQAGPSAPAQPPAPADVERVSEPAKEERPTEVAKAEKSREVVPTPKPTPTLRPTPAPRVERVTRAAEAPREVTPAHTRSAVPASRPRPTAAVQPPPKVSASRRALPISSPPPAANSKKVIQWP